VPGGQFTQAQKQMILEANRQRNGGFIRSDRSGEILVPPTRHVPNVSPPINEAHIDHIMPRSKGGANSFDNAQVLSRTENLKKSDN
jgi:5-methylcytosine-specific restriction endonuclease McrA